MPCNILGVKSDLAIQINQAFDEENIFIPYSKDIQLEEDYTMTEKRKSFLTQLKTSPLFNPPQAAPDISTSEMIDFDEMD